MSSLDLLYVYDATIEYIEEREDADWIVKSYGRIDALAKQLQDLADSGKTFKRCIITTHGIPGHLKLHGDYVDGWGLMKNCADKGLHRLFPTASRLSFNGCEVAAEPGGMDFLTAAAQIFLKTAGGTISAWNSNGYLFPLPWIHKGHIVHYSGGTIELTIGPGGVIIPQPEMDLMADPPDHRYNVGNRI